MPSERTKEIVLEKVNENWSRHRRPNEWQHSVEKALEVAMATCLAVCQRFFELSPYARGLVRSATKWRDSCYQERDVRKPAC